jgi:tetratricopeptide (TPR) repeat protein
MLRDLAELTSDTSADEARSRLAELSGDPEVAERLLLVLGIGAGGDGNASGVDREIAWGFQRLAERMALTRPLVLVFDDIHWAEPALLDLIEHLVTWVREAPLLVICPARPELLDRRPAWGSGRLEASRISLQPLGEEESRSLLAALLAVDGLPPELRQRVLERAEGNPLFVEEVVRMLIDEGIVEARDGRWVARHEAAHVRVPETVEALIRARLDTLPPAERAVIQAASVVGRVFQQSAVAAIAPTGELGAGEGRGAGEPLATSQRGPVGSLDHHLDEAILRDLITEERSPDRERTFRFRHVLIRDAAYATLPKARRAELHRGVAEWLAQRGSERPEELVEIHAYHLEQTALLRRELDGQLSPDDRAPAVGALSAAARKALERDDLRAARQFAQRALDLGPEAGEGRLELRSLLAHVLHLLEQHRAAADLGAEVEREAAAAGRADLQGRAILAQAGDLWVSLGTGDVKMALRELERARQLLTAAGDTGYLCQVLEWLGFSGWWSGDFDDSERWWTAELELAGEHGWPSRQADALLRLGMLTGQRGDVEGRRQALERAEVLAGQGNSKLMRAKVKTSRGAFLARSGSTADAERLLLEAERELDELGDVYSREAAFGSLGALAYRAGRFEDALRFQREQAVLVADHAGRLPEAERAIAISLLAMGQLEEAERHAEHAVEVVSEGDTGTVASTKAALGLVREAQGRTDEAERLLRDACAIIAQTDFNPWEDQLALAEFLLRAQRTAEGQEWLERALASARRYGPESELPAYVEQRGARAADG